MRPFLALQCGEVESFRFRCTPPDLDIKMPTTVKKRVGKKSKKRTSQSAYIVFKDQASVPKAVALNMREFAGHHIRVDVAIRPRDPQLTGLVGDGVVEYDVARSIFLGNLSWDVEDEEVIRFFTEAQGPLSGAVEAVRLVRDRESGLGKGIGFVLFKTKDAVRAALEMDGKQLKERKLRVTRVVKLSEKKKRKALGLGKERKKYKSKDGAEDGKQARWWWWEARAMWRSGFCPYPAGNRAPTEKSDLGCRDRPPQGQAGCKGGGRIVGWQADPRQEGPQEQGGEEAGEEAEEREEEEGEAAPAVPAAQGRGEEGQDRQEARGGCAQGGPEGPEPLGPGVAV